MHMVRNTKVCNEPMISEKVKTKYLCAKQSVRLIASKVMPEQNRTQCKLNICWNYIE